MSATDVPPQQAEWTWKAMADTMVDPRSTAATLPPELYECIQEQLSETLMTRAEAEMYRHRLMSERTSFLVQHERTVIQQPFDMCEH